MLMFLPNVHIGMKTHTLDVNRPLRLESFSVATQEDRDLNLHQPGLAWLRVLTVYLTNTPQIVEMRVI